MLTNDEVTRLAQETGLHLPYWDDKDADETGEVGGPPAGWTMVSPFGLPLERFAHAVEREAYRRAAAECRVTCGKNHANAATFKSGTKAYVQGCDDCEDAIRALGEQHD